MVLVFVELAGAENYKVIFGQALGLAHSELFLRRRGMIALFVYADAVDMSDLRALAELLFCQGIVFLVDGDQQVALLRHILLDRIEDQPGFLGRAFIEMESVGHVDDLGALLSGLLRRQTGNNAAHGRIAEDHVVVLLRQQFLELLIRLQIVRALR